MKLGAPRKEIANHMHWSFGDWLSVCESNRDTVDVSQGSNISVLELSIGGPCQLFLVSLHHTNDSRKISEALRLDILIMESAVSQKHLHAWRIDDANDSSNASDLVDGAKLKLTGQEIRDYRLTAFLLIRSPIGCGFQSRRVPSFLYLRK
jgi:hypothetical protein